MPSSLQDKNFLNYYQREIDSLRTDGAEFAREFPKIAGRLNFDHLETADPHVARLLESFAFLTAQVQYKMDNVAFDLTNALIDTLYPHLNKPLPSLSIAEFRVDDGGNKPPQSGFEVARHTELFAYSSEGNACRFSTVYPLTLLPICITKIDIVPQENYNFVVPPATVEFGYNRYRKKTTYFCEVTLECFEGTFADLAFQDILFYIDMPEDAFRLQFYRSITSPQSLVYGTRGESKTALPLLPGSLQKMGFEREDMAIPPTQQENHAYQLIQEYFHFSEKFMFFKICQLDFLRYLQGGAFLNSPDLKLLIPVSDASSEWSKKMSQNTLRLNCTPIINLFRTTTDPVSLDEKRVFYRMTPNAHKDKTMEIYSLETVFATEASTGASQIVSPYFSFSDSPDQEAMPSLFWWSRTVPTHYKNLTGIDTEISFVDTEFKVAPFEKRIVYASALCTNRFMAEDLFQGTPLQIEKATPTEEIVCLKTPVSPQYSLKKGNNNAKLIAQLSVNYLGFPYAQDSNIVNTLKTILMMHTSELTKDQTTAMLHELDSVNLSTVTRRLGQDAWRGAIDGVHVEMNLHSTDFLNEWYLLALILQRYFAMNCQINTFVELTVRLDQVTLFHLDPLNGGLEMI